MRNPEIGKISMRRRLLKVKGTSKNLSFDHLILYPSPKGEGQAEFLEVPLNQFSKDLPMALNRKETGSVKAWEVAPSIGCVRCVSDHQNVLVCSGVEVACQLPRPLGRGLQIRNALALAKITPACGKSFRSKIIAGVPEKME